MVFTGLFWSYFNFWGYFGHFMGSVLFWSYLCFGIILVIIVFRGYFVHFGVFEVIFVILGVCVHVGHYGVSWVILVTLEFSGLFWWFIDILVVLGVLSVF
jgi:hypothetical protein